MVCLVGEELVFLTSVICFYLVTRNHEYKSIFFSSLAWVISPADTHWGRSVVNELIVLQKNDEAHHCPSSQQLYSGLSGHQISVEACLFINAAFPLLHTNKQRSQSLQNNETPEETWKAKRNVSFTLEIFHTAKLFSSDLFFILIICDDSLVSFHMQTIPSFQVSHADLKTASTVCLSTAW